MLSRLFSSAPVEEVRSQATVWGDWPGDAASTQVTTTTAMQLLAVSGCVRLITDSISTLPIDTYTEDKQGVKTEVAKPAWLKQPTVDLDFTAWCTQILTSLLLHGNAYCVVTRSGTSIVEVIPVDPSQVTVTRAGGRKRFLVSGREFPGEILHLKGMMLPGSDVGLSPLEYARKSISLGIEAVDFGVDLFQQSLNMPGVIEYPGQVNPDTLQRLAQSWRKNRSRRNRGLPGVLDAGGQWKGTGVTSEQAQFLQTRQWTAAEIAGQVFMIDPRELGIPVTGTSLDYTNSESRKANLLTKALLPWMIRIEAAVSSLLPMPRYMKFNVDGFLRGDSSERWSIYKTAMEINNTAAQVGQPPVLLTKEMREFEDLNIIEEYPGAKNPQPEVQQNSAPPVVVNAYITVPESRAEAPSVTVQNDVHVPEQRQQELTVNVEPPGVVVDVQPTTVHVPAPEVRLVEREPETRTVTKTIHRDGDGRIQTVTEEIS